MGLDLFSGAQREPAGCVIKVGVAELEITDLYPFLTGVEIECSRTDAWTATLTFESRRDEQGKWAVQDSGVLSPWEPILIEASFGSDSDEIFRGYIREVSASYPEEAGDGTVTVECQDQSIAFDRTHVRQDWGKANAPTTDGQIFQQIVARNPLVPPLKPVAKGQGLSGLHLFQDSTDITFLRHRAEVNGYELIFAKGEVYFGPMRLSGEPQPTILVYAGRDTNCLRFDVRADGHQPEKVAYEVAATEGTATQERILEPDIPLLGTEPAAGGGPGLRDYVWRLRRQGTTDEAELTARAQAKANELSLRVKADGELDGTLYGHVLRVGELVPVDGVGDRLSGLYYVDTVSHRFSTEGYRQSFRLLRNAYGDNVPSGPLGGAFGGMVASVSASFSFGL
jgi:phage protein D